jgi:ComF family protein
MKLINIKTFFLDLLFPIKCLGCEKENTFLCEECNDSIPLDLSDTPTMYLDHLYTASDFNHPLLNKVIKEFKYRFVKDLSWPLAWLAIRFVEKNDLQFDSPVLIPVPLSSRRSNWRGFNQAELIARHIAKHFDWTVDTDIICRVRTSKPQADIENKAERKENIKNSFRINSDKTIKETCILIDDVATTGSTLNECARILKQNGAKNVIGLTIARG